MKKFLCIICLLISLGCSDRSTDGEIQNSSQRYHGVYFAADDSANIAQQKTDSVELYIVNFKNYSLTFTDESGGISDFCDNSGTVSGFFTNVVRFTPTDFFEANCDSIRVPNGEFQGDYISHGDTIYITYTNGDTLRRLKLVE